MHELSPRRLKFNFRELEISRDSIITTFSFVYLSPQFKCCGINGDEDYLQSKWRNDSQATTEKRQVPLSCCIQQEPGEV